VIIDHEEKHPRFLSLFRPNVIKQLENWFNKSNGVFGLIQEEG
jgi:hypothetical protein